jgi:DNA primase
MAKIISKQVLEEIRFRNDIAQVIGSYLKLQRAGSAFKANCPFHKEKTPSFHVNPQRQIYHCFGCGAGGDVFAFVMQYEAVDFSEAVRRLAERAGIALEMEEGAGSGPSSDKAVLYKLHSELATLYHRALLESKSGGTARDYVAKRGLTPETVEDFLIGYAPNRWDCVVKWAQKEKYALELVEKGGLILKSQKPNARADYYDRFRHRLMFPIRDEQGRVIGFSGRILEDDGQSAKYVNSPETPLFQKSRVLYALDKARRHIADSREALVCEGQIDVIRCHQAGFQNAVAAQGTAFTEDHVRILGRYADSVILIFDPDKAGEDASVRAAGVFMRAGLAVRVARLPSKEDPDAFIRKHGADAFRAILTQADSAVSFQIAVLSSREDATAEVGVMRIARAVLETIRSSPSAVQKAKLIQETAERLRLPVKALEDEFDRTAPRIRPAPTEDAERKLVDAAPPRPKEEEALCQHLLQSGDTAAVQRLVRDYLPLEMVSHPLCRAVVVAALQVEEQGNIFARLAGHDDPSGELQRFAAAAQMAPSKLRGKESSAEQAVRDIILRLWARKLERERAELERYASTRPGSPEERRGKEITCDLKMLQRWETGATIIELKLSR